MSVRTSDSRPSGIGLVSEAWFPSNATQRTQRNECNKRNARTDVASVLAFFTVASLASAASKSTQGTSRCVRRMRCVRWEPGLSSDVGRTKRQVPSYSRVVVADKSLLSSVGRTGSLPSLLLSQSPQQPHALPPARLVGQLGWFLLLRRCEHLGW